MSRLKLSREELEEFTDQIKERKMGELFTHFKGYDVPATRREVREEDIRILVDILRRHGISKEDIKKDLMEKYDLDEAKAQEKIEAYW